MFLRYTRKFWQRVVEIGVIAGAGYAVSDFSGIIAELSNPVVRASVVGTFSAFIGGCWLAWRATRNDRAWKAFKVTDEITITERPPSREVDGGGSIGSCLALGLVEPPRP